MPLFMYKEPMDQRCSLHLDDISSFPGGHGMKLALCPEHLSLFGKDAYKQTLCPEHSCHFHAAVAMMR